MKLGIDLCSFRSIHRGGKDEVAYNLLRGFERLGYSKDIVCFCYPELVENVRAISKTVEICTVPTRQSFGGMKRYLVEILDGLAVLKQLRNYKVDAILFTNKESPLIKFPVKTFVITHDIQLFHQNWEGHKKLKLYNRISRFLIKCEFALRDCVFSISDFDKTEIERFVPSARRKVKRMYNPIRFSECHDSAAQPRNITALNIQWDHKNVKTLLRAYALIADQIQYDLILVGKKPNNYNELEQFVRDHYLEERVTFTGFVDEARLHQIISETRIYVNPSFFEGFGMTAVEMMGWCIPTIVAANTAQPEVTMGLCRYYEPTDDAKALAQVIMEEINDPQEDAYLKAVSQKVRESYSYINIAQAYWNVIENELRSGR